jgi:hypothetical protein
MLPPDTIATAVLFSSTATRPCSSAATAMAPPGSANRRPRVSVALVPAMISSSLSVTISSTT